MVRSFAIQADMTSAERARAAVEPLTSISRRGSNHHLVIIAAVFVFLVYAITFLCFFVDDEAITFVYAQNVLRGRGLMYSAYEGAAEGYSNFLQVGVDTAVLAVVNAMGWPKLSAFALGKGLSLASGLTLVAVVGQALRRVVPDTRAHLGPLLMLALSGPVALWSCSSLETVPFVLLFTGFVVSLLHASRRAGVTAAALGAATILMRVDGFVYVAVAWTAAFVFAAAEERPRLFRHVALPLAAIFCLYHGWRYWYFGSLLSLPLQTKVLYKLFPHDTVVKNVPATPYVARFLEIYHPAALAALACGWMPFWRPGDDRRPFVLLTVATAIVTYASVVGDWMMGFRFLAVLFPLLAFLAAFSFAAVFRHSARVAIVCVVATVCWSATTAHAFVRVYESDRVIGWRSWWTRPTLDPHLFFAPYYGFYEHVRGVMPPGTTVVNNQAGFLPFMLDLENIDDLAICSRFLAAMPTADVVFTETGRYFPLTPRHPLIAGETYLLHRRPQYVVALKRLLWSSNDGRVPDTLLGGAFREVEVGDFQVLYRSTGESLAADVPESYRENVAHPAYLRTALRQGSVITRPDLLTEVPFLVGKTGHYGLAPSATFEVHLRGDPVLALWLESLVTTTASEVTMTLHDRHGGIALEEHQHLLAGERWNYDRQLDHAVAAGVFTLTITSASTDGSVEITDLRLLGQTPALRAHVTRELFTPRFH